MGFSQQLQPKGHTKLTFHPHTWRGCWPWDGKRGPPKGLQPESPQICEGVSPGLSSNPSPSPHPGPECL